MDEERIALFLDFENLAIGAREQLGGTFEFRPIADALAERGRVVVRRAYADWSMFGDAGRDLTRHHVELIEIPQKMGAVRKNAADIKLAVDAIELCYERDYITTFVVCTGDSDFTPLVHKLRELNKRVIGIGVEAATSNLLPPACDEFLFYERLQGVDVPRRGRRGRRRDGKADTSDNGDKPTDLESLGRLVTQTLSGLKRRSSDAVLGSMLKRTLLRKDPTFDEADYGFRSLGEMLRTLQERGVIQLTDAAPGDPEVDFPAGTSGKEEGFELLKEVVAGLGSPRLRGLKNEVRKRESEFSEKVYGYGAFSQFVKAAEAAGVVAMSFDDEIDDYRVTVSDGTPAATEEPAAEAEPEAEAAATPEKKKPVRKRRTKKSEEPEADAKAEKKSGDRVISRTTVKRKSKKSSDDDA